MNAIRATKKNCLPEDRLVVRDREHLNLLGRFIQAYFLGFLKKPGKVRIIKQTSLTVAFDPGGRTEQGLTLSFKKGRVFIENGIRPGVGLRITGEPTLLMMLTRVPAGRPLIQYLLSYEGRDIIKRVRSGELRLRGFLRHPVEAVRFARIMAPNVE